MVEDVTVRNGARLGGRKRRRGQQARHSREVALVEKPPDCPEAGPRGRQVGEGSRDVGRAHLQPMYSRL